MAGMPDAGFPTYMYGWKLGSVCDRIAYGANGDGHRCFRSLPSGGDSISEIYGAFDGRGATYTHCPFYCDAHRELLDNDHLSLAD
jgi:hypothetical protein